MESSRNLKIGSFIVAEDHLATGEKWEEWIEELEREMRFFRVKSAEDKRDAVLIYGGPGIRRLEKCLPDTEESNVYLALKAKLTNYFAPKKNKYYHRYIFLNMRPLQEETTASYATRLKEKAAGCEFHDDNERILEHLMQTSDNEELIRKVIYKKLNLQETLESMQILEETSWQAKAMSHESEIAKIKRKDGNARRQRQSENNYAYERCKYCDRKHQKKKELCPAWGKTCSKCEGLNHFASACLKGRNQKKQSKSQFRDSRQEVRKARFDSSSDDSESEPGNRFLRHLKIGKVRTGRNNISRDSQRRRKKCSYCGRAELHRRKEDCEAYGKICWNCYKVDHLERVCRLKDQTKLKYNDKDMAGGRSHSVHRSVSTENEFSDESTACDNNVFDRMRRNETELVNRRFGCDWRHVTNT